MNSVELLMTVGLMMLGTMATRFIPFLFFPENKPIPVWLVTLGERLPYASLGMLLVYALKDVVLASAPFGLPELLSLTLMGFVHRLFKDTLVSIGSGVGLYLVLVNLILK